MAEDPIRTRPNQLTPEEDKHVMDLLQSSEDEEDIEDILRSTSDEDTDVISDTDDEVEIVPPPPHQIQQAVDPDVCVKCGGVPWDTETHLPCEVPWCRVRCFSTFASYLNHMLRAGSFRIRVSFHTVVRLARVLIDNLQNTVSRSPGLLIDRSLDADMTLKFPPQGTLLPGPVGFSALI